MGPGESGYITEIGYTHDYQPELAPGLLALALLNGGTATRAAEPLRYLELGFGQGHSLNIHAAACPGEYWGADINPVHVAHARALAQASGSRLRVLEDSFAELAARRDLPEFDIIVAHGILSWVSAANHAAIVDIVRRTLADGGMFYVSYNCTPGWSPALPLRHLLSLHADLAGTGKGILDRVDGALAFAQQVADAGVGYFKVNPAVAARLNAIKEQDRTFVAHEFFNAEWAVLPFSRVAELLAPAHVGFAASANLLHHLDGISLPPAARQLLGEIDHPILRESVRDYLINANFRRDIFVKGGRPMPAPEREARYLRQRFVLTRGVESFPTDAGGTRAEFTIYGAVVTLKEDFYRPLIDALVDGNYAPRTLHELSTHPRLEGRALPALITALVILCAAGIVRPAQDAEAVGQARPRCKALNAALLDRPPAAGESAWLASPVSGTGVAVSRNEALFLRARRSGKTSAEDWARFAWDNFESAEGHSIAGAAREERLAALTGEAKSFAAQRLPLLRALEVT